VVSYCNSLLASLALVTITPLEHVQHTVAHLIFELGTREHVTASLLQLHWLLVRWRVQFKLCCLMHSVFYGKCPDYLANVMSPVDCGVHIAVFDLYHHRISVCRSYAPSLASMPSHMPARLHGTHYRRTYVLSLILDILENDSRHFFSLAFCIC